MEVANCGEKLSEVLGNKPQQSFHFMLNKNVAMFTIQK
jgi:hypothetical protein